jgi:transposase
MGKKCEMPVEGRVDVVLALLRKEEPASQIARRHGISEPTLYRWRDDFLAAGKERLRGKAGGDAQQAKEISRLQREIEAREQVIGELTVANRILKKLSGPSL